MQRIPMAKSRHYAVIGHSVSHSLSPHIHRCFASQFDIALEYNICDIPTDCFEKCVADFFISGHGLNVTTPFKQRAWEIADQLTERALVAEAANTLWIDDNNRLCADNTDGTGLVKDLTINLGFKIKDSRIVIVGAGGAVRGVLHALLREQPETIVLMNRTQKKADSLVKKFQQYGSVISFTEKHHNEAFDLIINGTSAGLNGQLPSVPKQIISKDTIIYDMAYGKVADNFLKWSSNHGAEQITDGTGMLVEQAAEAFFIWHNLRPQTSAIISSLKNH